MKCDECGGTVNTERNAVRRYTLGGLPHVVLNGVEVTTCTACGQEEIGIPRIAQLHRALAEAFVAQRRMLAPEEIRFLRKHMGLSSVDFARKMGVERETVSRWEHGTRMSSTADHLLRMLVVSHTPPESYAVEDVLRDLGEERTTEAIRPVSLWNSQKKGWTRQEQPGATAA